MAAQKENNLTNKQKIFVEEYIQCWNATKAAELAGYKGNKDTLRSVGCENLAKPYIKDYIDQRINEVSMSSNEVLKRLTDWGRGSIAPFLKADDYSQSLDVSTESAQDNLQLIKKIKQNDTVRTTDDDETVTNRTFEIELHDAKDAVDKIARIRGMYNDSLQVTGEISLFDALTEDEPNSQEE